MTIEARIEYVTTDEGVSLACTKFGSGPPLIYHFSGPYVSHFEMEFEFPPVQAACEALARVATLIRYDFRNTGLSTRGVEDVSVAAHVRDLDAVMRHFQLESAALLYPFNAAKIAVEYAAAQPERVTALVLWAANLDAMGSRMGTPQTDILKAALRLGHEAYASLFAVMTVGLEAHANAAWYARWVCEGSNLDDSIRVQEAIHAHNSREAAVRVRTPTLFASRRSPSYNLGPPSPEMIREHRALTTHIAATIPGAQSASFDGTAAWISGDEFVTGRIPKFLNEILAKEGPQGSKSGAPTAGGTRTILFTDIVGHTEMMQRLGDTKGRDVLREHERITRDLLKKHGGAEVKTMGDGFMASFGSVTSAMECAIALQRAFATHTESMPEPLHVRVGLNAGEPIEEDGDLFGATVILASRIAAKAGAGEILIPEPVRHLLSGKAFTFADRGEFEMKGFDDAVRLYEVRWREDG
jgi:class 3 adenylate cyclase/pimeloyl-ACP methyl ester carboxylesterase